MDDRAGSSFDKVTAGCDVPPLVSTSQLQVEKECIDGIKIIIAKC